ncbi:MAG: MGDG synthase family glycosyltransferase [Chroococcales cyanobacterium]
MKSYQVALKPSSVLKKITQTQNQVSSVEKKVSIDFLVLRGGGGHYATYKALRSIIEQQQLPWELNVTFADTIAEHLAAQNQSLDIYRLFGTNSDEFYDRIQQNGWSWVYRFLIRLNKLLIQLNYEAGVKILEENWRKKTPDLVISVVPFFNKGLWESLNRVKPNTPIVTLLIDFADCPPGYWIEPETTNYVVCGTEKAVEQARDLGVAEDRIVQTSGMVIHPRFYQPISCDRRLERQRLGLDPDCMTGLVLFGANGSNVMLDIAKRLEAFDQKLQLIFLCGRNEEVAASLRKHKSLQKRLVVTFTEDIPYYMHLADFFIGKPGPGSVSEALAMKLPVIVQRNFSTLPQERSVCDWIEQREVGLVIRHFRQIDTAVQKMLQPERYTQYRANVTGVDNHAVLEIPEILQQILTTHTCESSLPSESVYC